MYFALIGDIKNSKKLSKRAEIQERLQSTLNEINSLYDEHIASCFTITLGDEFQGLLKTSDQILNIIERIKMKMYPVKIRFGIGYGTIETKINRELSIGADGPAFHKARNMIDEIKKNEKAKLGKDINVMFSVDKDYDALINATLALCSFVEKKWTKRQREIIYDYIQYGDNQRKAANRLGITQSNIQRGMKNSGYYNYLYAFDTIHAVLKRIEGGPGL